MFREILEALQVIGYVLLCCALPYFGMAVIYILSLIFSWPVQFTVYLAFAVAFTICIGLTVLALRGIFKA